MLRREKWVVNHKRVYRLYREEGLAMRRRKGKRFSGGSASAIGTFDTSESDVDDGFHSGQFG